MVPPKRRKQPERYTKSATRILYNVARASPQVMRHFFEISVKNIDKI
jgi:hypothetical protein